jgi:uncharacterized protein
MEERMKISGSHVLHAPRQEVWDALRDPAVMTRAIPGCETLWETDDGTLMAHVRVGVGAIDGLVDGPVALHDDDPPKAGSVDVAWRGVPGTIAATVKVRLRGRGTSTTVDYDADVQFSGPIAAVGQRLLTAAAQRNAAYLFASVDQYLTGARNGQAAPAHLASPLPVTGEATRPAPLQLLLAASAGAAAALASVALTRRRAR